MDRTITQPQETWRRLIRAANILICIAAIGYFSSFLGFVNADVSWLQQAWFIFVGMVVVFPQIFPLLFILGLEARSTGTLRGHAGLLLAIIALSGLGYFWSTGVIESMQH
jgi:hypothetical protein